MGLNHGLTGFTFIFSWQSTRYSKRLHDFSVTIPSYKDVYVNSFFPYTAIDTRILCLLT